MCLLTGGRASDKAISAGVSACWQKCGLLSSIITCTTKILHFLIQYVDKLVTLKRLHNYELVDNTIELGKKPFEFAAFEILVAAKFTKKQQGGFKDLLKNYG